MSERRRTGPGRRPRVVVCGTKFGRVYLAASRQPGFPFHLAGILARGSRRSRSCAEHYGVPLYDAPERLPADIDIACVVVGAGLNGGPGAELAMALMARGIHVLQEHPLHHDELADCLRAARRHGVVYHLNTHYVHVRPVRRFVAAATELFRRQRPLFVDATCAFQVVYSLFDILGEALGSVRPWAFGTPPDRPAELDRLSGGSAPFRTLDGLIAGVPFTLRVQNQLDPGDPDNHAHLLHRITVGSEGGHLSLVETHGPVLWSARPRIPEGMTAAVALDQAPGEGFDRPSTAALGPAEAPSFQEVVGSLWPAAVGRALGELHRTIRDGEDAARHGQRHLTLCRLWQDVTGRLGPPDLIHHDIHHDGSPGPVLVDELSRATAEAELEALT
jgi:pyochelin biosynthesis protein PchG